MKKFILLIASAFVLTTYGQTRTVGTLINTNEAYEGYTLLSPLHSNNFKTYLINNCGDTVHSWTATLSAGLTATLLPDGRLLRPAIDPTSTIVAGGSGGRVQVFDWDNTLVWDFPYSSPTYNTHHEVVAMPNGNFLILTWDKKDSSACVAEGRDPNTIPDKAIWSEKIIEVQPTGLNTGNIVWEWDIWDHLVQDFDATKQNYGVVADHPELLNVNHLGWSAGGKDWLHANAINYNAVLDQIVMSCRYTHEIYIIDHSTSTAEAAGHTGGLRGKGGDILFRWGNPLVYGRGTSLDQTLHAQHNSAWIREGLTDEGKIMIFNNGTARPGGEYSSVEVINPLKDVSGNYVLNNGVFALNGSVWTYTTTQPSDFFSNYIGGAERLPNGNTLICNGTWGHLFEVAPDGEIVWEYISPVTTANVLNQGDVPPSNPLHGTLNWVFRASKYPLDFPAFANKTLTPGAPVEQNPMISICDPLTVIEPAKGEISVYPNPTNGLLSIEGGKAGEYVRIYNSTGSLVKSVVIQSSIEQLDLSGLSDGIYFMQSDKGLNKKLVLNKFQ